MGSRNNVFDGDLDPLLDGATVMGDKTAMRPFATLWTLVASCFIIVSVYRFRPI